MALTLVLQNGQLQPRLAIEFLGSRTRANPVWTEDREDLERLLDMFFGYTVEAEHYLSSKTPVLRGGSIPSIELVDVSTRRARLLKKWAAEVKRSKRR